MIMLYRDRLGTNKHRKQTFVSPAGVSLDERAFRSSLTKERPGAKTASLSLFPNEFAKPNTKSDRHQDND